MCNKVTIIRNGHVIDPMNNVDQLCDIAIQDGKIVAVGRDLPDACDNNEFDAKGCYVVPGLIDIHVHVYQYCTVLGANPDESCLARGMYLYSTILTKPLLLISYWPKNQAELRTYLSMNEYANIILAFSKDKNCKRSVEIRSLPMQF